jgi:hypothetical protein
MSPAGTQVFSQSYAQAREKFLDAARKQGISIQSKLHPEQGREGEELAMDVARDGGASADKLLIVSSGCHGVEGFCGSGVQIAALQDTAWRDHARERGVAVVYVHALNPYGFSHLRRVTQENVDLNRNFQDFSKPLPVNEAYRELHPLVQPEQWPPSQAHMGAIMQYVAGHGEAAFQAAISRGQYEFPDGMFFGGTAPTWSNLTLREVLREHGHRAARIAWIDIHTGLGPSGVGERIFAGRDDAATLSRARSWWGGAGATPVTSIYDGSSTSALLTGMMFSAVYDECPQAQYTGIALEYGTVPVMQMIQTMLGEHWLHLHPAAPPALAAHIKQQMKAVFFTDTDQWKQRVLEQAREALFQAVDGLAS